MLDGLEITPLSTHIYSYDEYRERYPDSLDAGEHAKDWKVIVYKLAFCNTTEKELRFEADSFLAVAQNSGFHNCVSQENRKKNQTIQPGEHPIHETLCHRGMMAWFVAGDVAGACGGGRCVCVLVHPARSLFLDIGGFCMMDVGKRNGKAPCLLLVSNP